MRPILLLLLAATAVQAEDFEKKYAEFRKYINRPSFRKRTAGLEILASSGDIVFDTVDTLNDVLAKEHAIKGKKVNGNWSARPRRCG